MAAYATEQELIEALRKGESPAFRALYVKHFSMVRYLVIHNSGRDEDAWDVFQEATVALYEQLRAGTFTQKSSLKTWLYAVCRNKWLKQLEKRKRNVRFTDFEAVEEVALPEEKAEDEAMHKMFRQSLEKLGAQCRKLLLLFYFFKKSMDEIASELGYTNADNAKAQKYKCLQKLKTIYKNTAVAQ